MSKTYFILETEEGIAEMKKAALRSLAFLGILRVLKESVAYLYKTTEEIKKL